MPHAGPLCRLGAEARKLFKIDEARKRADALRDVLLPKLRPLLPMATERLGRVYGVEPLEIASRTVGPAHRKEAAITKDIGETHVGLVGGLDKSTRKRIYVELILLLTGEGLRTLFWINRPEDAEPYFELLERYPEQVERLLSNLRGAEVWFDSEGDPGDSFVRSLPQARIPALEHLWHTGISGPRLSYPIDLEAAKERLIRELVVLYPIFQAVVDSMKGRDDRFLEYCERFEVFVQQAGTPGHSTEGDIEGELRKALRRHRKREHRLRRAKVHEALEAGGGRLLCEVRGCGFDFVEVYGELGQGFAHVHHRRPLAELDGPTPVSLEDLAVVCPNCHAMIHRWMARNRGAECPLDRLVVTPSRV